MIVETWRDIDDFPGYQISNLGRVRSFNKTTYTNRHGFRHWKNRIIKQKIGRDGRARVDCICVGKRIVDGLSCLLCFACENPREVPHWPDVETIPEWCPMVEISTPHGRLIDADEFISKIINYQRQSTKTIGQALGDTSTVIEAEY